MSSDYCQDPVSLPNTPTSLYYTASEYGSLDRLMSGQEDVFGTFVDKTSVPLQMRFIRRVMGITASQVAVTLVSVLLLAWMEPILQTKLLTWWVPLLVGFLIAITFLWRLWVHYFQASKTTHIVLLTLFSIFAALPVSSVLFSLCYEDSVLVLFLTLASLCGLSIYTFQARYAFTGLKPIICNLASVCLIGSMLRTHFLDLDPIEILRPISISFFVTCYFILDLYYIMSGVTVDDYILANVCFFVDLSYPVRYLHHLCELSDQLNMPDILYPGRPQSYVV